MGNLQNEFLNGVGIDRLLHFLMGGWVACLAPTWYYALLVGFMGGLVKELLDRFVRKSEFDCCDWAMTLAGSAVTAVVILMKGWV